MTQKKTLSTVDLMFGEYAFLSEKLMILQIVSDNKFVYFYLLNWSKPSLDYPLPTLEQLIRKYPEIKTTSFQKKFKLHCKTYFFDIIKNQLKNFEPEDYPITLEPLPMAKKYKHFVYDSYVYAKCNKLIISDNILNIKIFRRYFY
jgi:hypothetical protein